MLCFSQNESRDIGFRSYGTERTETASSRKDVLKENFSKNLKNEY